MNENNQILRMLLIPALSLAVSCTDSKTGDEQPAPTSQVTAAQTIAAEVEEPEPFDDSTLPFRAIGPVATINGVEVGQESFNDAARRFGKMAKFLDRERLDRYRARIVSETIRDALTEQKLATAKVEVADDVVDAKFEQYLDENFHSDDDIEEYYRRTGMSADRVRADIRKSLMLEAYLDATYGTSVTDEEVKEYYEERSSRFKAPEEVHAAHILIDLARNAPPAEVKEKRQAAQKLARDARKAGADFAALAKEHSSGPRADKGGDLGWFAQRQMVPEFSTAAFKLQPGEVSDPVRSAQGLHIIKVYERRPERIKPLEEAGVEIRDSMSRQRKRDASVKFMQDLRKAATIEEHPDNIVDNPDFVSSPVRKPGHDIAPDLDEPSFKMRAPIPEKTAP